MKIPDSKTPRLAIIGTGGMAHSHAEHFQKIDECEIVAVCDIVPGRAADFGKKFAVSHAFTSVEELLAFGEFDAATVVTPDASHAPTSLALIKAGKHVLCEKPLALNQADALKMTRAAERAGVINMVNLSYRNWSAIQAVAALIEKGTIGTVVHVEASYLQSWLPSKIWGDWRTTPGWLWRLSTLHGSNGVLGDVGVHILDFAMFPAGPITSVSCRLKAFPKAPKNRVGEYVLDANDSAVMTVEFANGALGSLHATRWSSGHANRLFLKISGTEGAVSIDSEIATDSYKICQGADMDKAQWQDVKSPATPNNYERFIRSIQTQQREQPDFATGARVQAVLDACQVSAQTNRTVEVQNLSSTPPPT